MISSPRLRILSALNQSSIAAEVGLKASLTIAGLSGSETDG
jgi:hypothetical protein